MMYMKALKPSGMGCWSLDPGCMVKSMYMVGVRVYTGERTLKASPTSDDDPDLHTVFLGPTDVLLL